MNIDDNIIFKREIDLNRPKSSIFLLGPRMTGKTYLLKEMDVDVYIDLLDVNKELELRSNPKLFWEQIEALPNRSNIIIDEIQKVPELLDYIHKAIEEKKHKFILSGSSARKLKKQSANLLAGRALDYKLWPLTIEEIAKKIPLTKIVELGSLPKVCQLLAQKNEEEAQDILRTYTNLYLKEEIQQESIVRKLASFQRFFAVAAQSHGEVVEYANIASECSVPSSTVKEYFQILEDTLVGFFLWPYNRSERKKARPKFYFFDNGVVRAIQGRLNAKPGPDELGHLFEAFFVNEVRRINSYLKKDFNLSLWRQDKYEIDLVISRGSKMLMAFEIKSGKNIRIDPSLKAFKRQFPKVPISIVSMHDELKRIVHDIEIFPCQEALSMIRAL
ncbi:MAG: ATP-binding protein [Pseudomonadota bacterium]